MNLDSMKGYNEGKILNKNKLYLSFQLSQCNILRYSRKLQYLVYKVMDISKILLFDSCILGRYWQKQMLNCRMEELGFKLYNGRTKSIIIKYLLKSQTTGSEIYYYIVFDTHLLTYYRIIFKYYVFISHSITQGKNYFYLISSLLVKNVFLYELLISRKVVFVFAIFSAKNIVVFIFSSEIQIG